MRAPVSDSLLDLRGASAAFIHISDGKLHAFNALDFLPIKLGALHVRNCGHLGFERDHAMSLFGAFLMIRAKTNIIAKSVYSKRTDRSVICDRTIDLTQWFFMA
jgi:hypothetical protein